MIKLGNSNIVGVSLGNTQFSKIYRGIDLVWQNKPIDVSDFIIDKSKTVVGDVVLYDKNNDTKIIVKSDKLNHFKNGYTPIGVVVIPASHDVYGTGECGVMALRYASKNKPDEGTVDYSDALCSFGFFGTKIFSTNYNCVNIFTDINSQNAITTINPIGTYCYLPVETVSPNRTECISDSITKYDTTSNNCIPSPYLNDGRNSQYYSGSNNGLSDFRGKENTETILSKVTTANWKTIESLSSVGYRSGTSMATCATWRYSTDGTKQGDWYLPSIGELGYLSVRFKSIDDVMTEIANVFGINRMNTTGSIASYMVISSTEYSGGTYNIFNLYLNVGGKLGYEDKYTENKDKNGLVIPFIRI